MRQNRTQLNSQIGFGLLGRREVGICQNTIDTAQASVNHGKHGVAPASADTDRLDDRQRVT
jgi:hypothetical protein